MIGESLPQVECAADIMSVRKRFALEDIDVFQWITSASEVRLRQGSGVTSAFAALWRTKVTPERSEGGWSVKAVTFKL